MISKRAANKGVLKRKPRVQREVIAALARRILSGGIPPREYLPKESELCAQYGVSRTVIREATKILESKGLLRSRSRVGTQVLDPNEWNMLDGDLLAWAGSEFHDPRFVYSLMEARFIIEPAAAELAAERADSRDLARLDEAYQRMQDSLPPNAPHDVQRCSEADLDFHTALLVGSHNHVLIQLASVIRAALRALFELTTVLGSALEQALHLHGEVVEAVRLRRPDAARAAILKILDAAVADLALQPSRIMPEILRPKGVDGKHGDGRVKEDTEYGTRNTGHGPRGKRSRATKDRKAAERQPNPTRARPRTRITDAGGKRDERIVKRRDSSDDRTRDRFNQNPSSTRTRTRKSSRN